MKVKCYVIKECRKKSLLRKIELYYSLQGLLLKHGPGPWNRNLKNLDPEKLGS